MSGPRPDRVSGFPSRLFLYCGGTSGEFFVGTPVQFLEGDPGGTKTDVKGRLGDPGVPGVGLLVTVHVRAPNVG